MADADNKDKKLFIDDDWKSRVEKEKEELSKKLDDKPAAGDEGEPATPFLAHVESMVIQAMMALGLVPHPAAQNRRVVDPMQARYLVDTLAMLKEKTKGNLDKEEQAYLDKVLPELQMTFVEVMKAVAKAQADGTLKTMGDPGDQRGGLGGIPGAGNTPLA